MICFTTALILISSCPVPEIINNTSTWVKFDQETLERARVRCGQIYPSAPCMKRFTKKAEREYSVMCGKDKEKNSRTGRVK